MPLPRRNSFATERYNYTDAWHRLELCNMVLHSSYFSQAEKKHCIKHALLHAYSLCCSDDNIVVIRAASRTEPPDSGGQLQLDFGKGVVIQRNVAGTGMERLRKVQPLTSDLALILSTQDSPSLPGFRADLCTYSVPCHVQSSYSGQ